MNVLILGFYDNSGAGYALKKAVEKHHPRDSVEHVYWIDTYLDYESGTLRPTQSKLTELVAWCDVLNLHDNAQILIPDDAPSRPTVVTYHGSVYRVRPRWFNMWDDDRGYKQTALTIDLTLFGPTWLQRPMIVEDFEKYHRLNQRHDPDQPFRIAHAPTNRALKGTNDIITVLANEPGIELDIIEGVSHAECLERKALAHITVDQFVLGPGVNALESALMGQPVIVGAVPEIVAGFIDKIGYWPFTFSEIGQLLDTVRTLRDDREFYHEQAHKAQSFVTFYHNDSAVSNLFLGLCQQTYKSGPTKFKPLSFFWR